MAQLPTLCEINYDKSDVWEDTAVPYRYRSLSARVNKDIQNGFNIHQRDIASSASFYEMQSYYRVNSAQTTDLRRPPTVFSTYSNQAVGPPSRASTLPPSYHHLLPPTPAPDHPPCDACTARPKEPRARTAPCKSLPNLDPGRPTAASAMAHHAPHHHHHPASCSHLADLQQPKDEPLKWVPALNTWVVDKNHNPVPYVTFVNSMSLKDRANASDTMVTEEEFLRTSNGPCGRFLSHMNLQQDTAKAMFAQKQAQIIRKRRLRHEREEKMLLSKSAIPTKSPTKVRFERQPSPPPPAPPAPVKPSLPPPPVPAAPRVAPPPPPPPEVPAPRAPPSPPRTPTPQPASTSDQTDDLADGVRDTSLREATPLPPTSPPSPLPPAPRTPTPKQATPPPPREPSPPPKQATPLPVEDIEGWCCSSPLPLPPAPAPPSLQMPKPEPPPPLRPKPKPEKHIPPPKDKPPPKPKPKKKPKVEKRPKPDKSKKNKDKSTAVPVVHVQEPPALELTVQAHDRLSAEEPRLSPPPPEVPTDTPPVVIQPITTRSASSSRVSSIHSSDFGADSSPPSPTPGGRREKRVRWRAAPKAKPQEEETASTPSPRMPVFTKRVTEWIWSDDDDDFSAQLPAGLRDREENSSLDPLPSPSPPPSSPSPPPPPAPVEMPKAPARRKAPPKKKKTYGPRQVDRSLQEQMERERLAEERRQKLLDRRQRKVVGLTSSGSEAGDGPRFEDYGFLAKYCIFTKDKLDTYRKIFENVDEAGRGWLSGEDVQVALRVVNKALTISEQRYLTRILEMTGYNAEDGADIKLFSVMAALSQKITALDEWLRMAIENIDLQQLDLKMFMCKRLWECNVDPDSNQMPLDNLCLELRAGGVSAAHEQEVRHKLGHLHNLDLLDFLAYIPLFILIHRSVVSNPFDNSRDK